MTYNHFGGQKVSKSNKIGEERERERERIEHKRGRAKKTGFI
jgi:hypothetical protein